MPHRLPHQHSPTAPQSVARKAGLVDAGFFLRCVPWRNFLTTNRKKMRFSSCSPGSVEVKIFSHRNALHSLGINAHGRTFMSAFDTKAWTQHYAPWTPHELEYSDDTLASIYDRNLERNADKPATYFFGRGQSYRELDQQVRAAAAGLKAFGIRPGDRVAIILPNCPQHLAAFVAIQKLGAT